MFVTSFYVGEAKHSEEEYKTWINNFSNLVKNNLFIFCNKEGCNLLNQDLKKFVRSVNDIFDLEKIKDYKDKYKEMWNIDPEKDIHNYRLYGIWNGKISMLKYASEHVDSKLYIWVDIGSNRENKKYEIFPSISKIKYLQNITKDSSMFFFQLYSFPKHLNNNISLLNFESIEGTSFGGSKSAIKNYFNSYFSIHDMFYKMKKFVGKDQELFNTVYYYKLSKVILFKYKSEKCHNINWFRFYDFYADNNCADVDVLKNFVD